MDIERFAKICELLTSSHPSERAVAAEKASAILDAAGLTWTEFVNRAAYGRDAYGEQPRKSATKFGLSAAQAVRELAKHRKILSVWEKEFVKNLKAHGPDLELSDKQWAVVIRLAVKAGIIGREAAA